MVQLTRGPNETLEHLPTPTRLQQENAKLVYFPGYIVLPVDGPSLALYPAVASYSRNSPCTCGALVPAVRLWHVHFIVRRGPQVPRSKISQQYHWYNCVVVWKESQGASKLEP